MVSPLKIALLCLAALPLTAVADEPKLVPDRRVYVPIEDLDVIVEKDARGVLLPKAEFEALLKQARDNAAAHKIPGVPAVLPRCDYTARIVGDHLLITATAELRQFHNDWHAWSFPLQRVAVEAAKIDDQAALIGRGSNGELTLLTPEAGAHRLQLELSTELVTLGSDQAAAFSLLGSAAGELKITLPPGKRLLVDGLHWERPGKVDEPAEYTIPIGGRSQIQLRITDRTTERAADALVFATTGYGLHVAPGEVTWHALTTLSVFGRPLDRVTLSVPGYLEIADIESTGLDSWQLSDEPANKERTLITLTFGQAFDGTRKITLRGVMTTTGDTPWTVPALVISQATSHVGQIIVQHPAGVRLQIVETEGVRRATREQKPISDMPDDMTKLAAVDSLRFDAWREDFTLRLVTQPKQRELHAAVAAILDVANSGIDWQVALTLTTRFAPLFEVDFTVPVEWRVSSATSADGQPLRWELLPGDAGQHKLRLRLPGAIQPGGATVIKLQLRRDVEGWPVESAPVEFPIPEITLPQATLTETALVVRGDDDLELAAEDVVGLDPAPLQAGFERLRFQSQDTHYSGRLKVTRKPARIAAQQVAFYRIDPQTVHAALFAQVTVLGGGARDLLVTLPEEVGAAVRFHTTGTQLIEQQPLTVENARRRWRLKFAERVHGSFGLITELELPRTPDAAVKAPMLAIADAEREFGALVVEAGPEQRVSITAVDAQGQPLQEMDPLDLPAVPYSPKERLVAVYRFVTTGPSLTLTEERFDKAAVPTAVCPSLAMVTIASQTGEVQQRAEYHLQLAGVQQLRIELPEKATFWAALLDGHPVEVRRSGGVYLIPVQGSGAGVVDTTLELFYREQRAELHGSGKWNQSPPVLSVLSGQGTALPVEVLQQTWEFVHPEDTLVIDANGPVEPTEELDTPGWLVRVRQWLRVPTSNDAAKTGFCVAVVSGALALLILLHRKFGPRGPLGAGLAVLIVLVICALLLPATQGGKSARRPTAEALPMPTAKPFHWSANGTATTPSAGVSDFAPPMEPAGAAPGMTAPPVVMSDGIVRTEPGATPSDPRFKMEAGDLAAGRRKAGAESQLSINGRKEMLKDAESERLREQSKRDEMEVKSQIIRAAAPKAPLPAPEAKPGTNFFAEQPPANQPMDQLAQQRGDQPVLGNVDGDHAPLFVMDPTTRQFSGLLSLALNLEPPPHARKKEFRYVGTGGDGNAALSVEYLNRRRGTAVRWFCLALGLLLGWFARCLRATAKIAIVAIGLAITCGLLPLTPVTWHVMWDGLFAAVCGAAAIWLLHGCCGACGMCCQRAARWAAAKRVAVLMPLALVPLVPSSIIAQEQQVKTPGTVVPGSPAVIFPYDAADAPLSANRVWLPHDKFIELYRLAHPEKPLRSPAPQNGGVIDAIYAAELSGETVTITARLTVRSYVDGQWSVALPVHGVAISEAKLDGKSAAVAAGVPASAGPQVKLAEDRLNPGLQPGLQLIIPTPGLHVVDLKFAVPAKLSGAAGNFSLSLASTPAAKLSFTLPQPKDSVRVNGSTSAYRRVTQGEKTIIEVPVDKGGDLSVSWQPEQSQGGGAAVIHIDSVTAITIADAGVTVSGGFRYRVRQGIVRDVSFTLPETVKLQSVSGPDVGGWEVVGDGPQRKLRVFLRRNVGDTTQLTIDGYLGHRVTAEASTFAVPEIAPQEVTAEIGHLAIYSGEQFSLRAEQVQALQQMNVENFKPEIPVTRADAAPQLLYRFSRRPWSITLRTSRLSTQLAATVQHGYWVTHRKVQTTSRVVCDLQRLPQSTLDLQVPAEWVILDVQSGYLKDWYATKNDNGATVTVEFDQPRQGQVELVILATESRDPTQQTVPLRTLSVRGAQKHQRQAAVWFDSGLTGQVASLGGWKSLDSNAAASELRNLRSAAIQFAFQSTADDPGEIGLTVTHATPRLSANALTSISVTDVALIYGFVWQWQIDAAAVDAFAVETPDWLAGRMDFTASNLREVTSAPAGQGRIRWNIALRGPVTGKFTLAATATLPPATDRINAPAVTFFGTNDTRPLELQRHFVLLINTSLSQLTAIDPSLTEPVQREDVPIVVRQELVNQATEFVRVKALNTAPAWTVQRYVAAAATQASVNLADLTTVLARDGTYRAMATYTIKNRGRQFLAVQLPAQTRLLSVTVQGIASRAVMTTLDGTPTFLVALPKTSAADLSFPVQLAYAGKMSLALPGRREVLRQELNLPAPRVVEDHPEFGIHVARTRWTVYLPDDLDASPVDDPKKTNLNWKRDQASDDTAVRVLLQDYSDLLSTLDSSSSVNPRAVAANNLKQLGAAINSYSVQLQNDTKLAEENAKLQQRFGKMSNALQNPAAVNEAWADSKSESTVELRSGDAQQQLSNAIISNSAILADNADKGALVLQQVDQTFNFRLQNPPVKPTAAKAAESAARQLAGNSLEARQQYQQQNIQQLESLNRELSEKKSRSLDRARQSGIGVNAPPQQTLGTVANGVERLEILGQPGANFGNGMVVGSGAIPQFGTMGGAGGMMGGGGFGGGMGQPMGAAGVQINNNDALAVLQQQNLDHLMDLGIQPGLGGQLGGGQHRVAGLSLPIELPQTGHALVFTKTLGDPKLTLALLPRQTTNWALGTVWAIGWLAALITLLVALRTARGVEWVCRTLPIVVAAAAVIGMLVLSGPLNIAATVVFVIAAVLTAWQHRMAAAS